MNDAYNRIAEAIWNWRITPVKIAPRRPAPVGEAGLKATDEPVFLQGTRDDYAAPHYALVDLRTYRDALFELRHAFDDSKPLMIDDVLVLSSRELSAPQIVIVTRFP